MSSQPAGRSLRHAPQPRVMFTPEVHVPKSRSIPPRLSSTPSAYNSPSLPNGSYSSPNGVNSQSPQPTNLNRPVAISVLTPANKEEAFQSVYYRKPAYRMPPTNNLGYSMTNSGGMFGVGVKGVDYFTRIKMAMNSGIQSELDWALGALLRVSYRSPDNLQLVDNQNLAQVLLDRISCAFFFKDGPVIDMSSSFSITDDQAVEYHRVLEALLIMRNVSLDPKNCQFLANQWQCREIVLKGLMLPFAYGYGEVRNHCLEILESISFHLVPDSSSDPLFSAIVHVLSESDDRGLIIPALRSISRLVIRDEQNIIFRIPDNLLSKIMRYLILDDEELISASLDFLYQYTAYASNTSSLLSTPFNVQVCITHLIRLLSYGIEEPKLEYVRLPRQKAPANPPKLNDEILAELLEFSEPDRATYWIRTAYEADPDGEVTQISLWKAYEAQFEEHARHGKKLLPAVDFIKNVTSAFRNSAAMVVVLPDGTKRFIIKGMKPREYPLPPSVAQNQEEVGKLVKQQREPTRFGVTAALVLQNMAKCKEGFSLLESNVHLLIRSIQLNPTVASYIEPLLDKFHSTDEDAAEITSM